MRRPDTLSKLGVASAAFALAAGCTGGGDESPAAPGGAPWFEDVTAQSGIDFEHVRAFETRYWLPEIMSGGAAWLDHDGDGLLDLYLVQGGDLAAEPASRPGNRMLRNLGDGRFADVTEASGTGDTGYGMGAAAADYDGDGDVDLYVTNVGSNVLYRNEGDGRFTNVSAMVGEGDASWSSSAVWLDYDRDRDPDLFVTNYINWASDRELDCYAGGSERDYCHPRHYGAPAADRLYRNDDGVFIDVTGPAGLFAAFGNGLGAVAADLDGDGWIDIYVANDGMPNQLWINQRDGRFVDGALLSGTAVNMTGQAEAGMGVAAVDVEQDGDFDLFMTHLRGETNTLYVNDGGFFRDATATAGLAAPSVPYTGFGLGFADFDNDGLLDLYVANGRVGRALPPIVEEDPFAEPNQLFRGLGGGRFAEVKPTGGTAENLIENSRAAAFADYDRDGAVDVAIVNNGGPARLLHNLAGGAGAWVQLRVLDADGRDALGAVLEVEAQGVSRWRVVQPGYSYLASNDPHVHIGLGTADAVGSVTVRWPDGMLERFGPLTVRRFHSLRRGEGGAVP